MVRKGPGLRKGFPPGRLLPRMEKMVVMVRERPAAAGEFNTGLPVKTRSSARCGDQGRGLRQGRDLPHLSGGTIYYT